ncbi:Glucosyltransferase-like protein [Dimargaris verticillata]|uniref:Alpha-1,3-glucosyltransferase n=1 Tax=Dimargaris verticillata TaxID=2761393 RepID=A0A9W8EFC6_9FUNG|nr:Glucosyltransferase-like protein [Dimargaris verticillata]
MATPPLAVAPVTRWLAALTTTNNVVQRHADWLLLLLAIYVRWAVALGPYSGYGEPPLYGDYEAQRHWMEVTLHLPPSKWYFYDPSYWQLDYPPVTAYVSWLCGWIAHHVFNPAWVALDAQSRGIETRESKMFMRATVLVCELLFYIPAVALFVNFGRKPDQQPLTSSRPSWLHTRILWLLTLLQPALIVIDHGHFQYNAVMLGLVVWAIVCFQRSRFLLGSICFTCAIMFKIMALYFAPAIFAYLLGKCRQSTRHGIALFVKLGLTVVATFAACLFPFLHSTTQLMQILHRVFPVARGLYEDKVANFWCASSVLIKWRFLFSQPTLVKLSMLLTLLAFLPTCVNLYHNPTIRRLLYALAVTSLAFYLFSFQVHEKSILLPALPITLLMSIEPTLAFYFVNVAMFSMFPLLQRDGVTLAYIVCTLFWNWLAGFPFTMAQTRLARCITRGTLVAMGAVHLADLFVPTPEQYPHLYIVANVILSCGAFGLCWLYLNYKMMCSPSAELGSESVDSGTLAGADLREKMD